MNPAENKKRMFRLDGKFVVLGELTERGYELKWCRSDGTLINRRMFYITPEKLQDAVCEDNFQAFLQRVRPQYSRHEDTCWERKNTEAMTKREIAIEQIRESQWDGEFKL